MSDTPPGHELAPDLQARKDEADVAKAQADAAKAKADADKAIADARAADATAQKAEAEGADREAPLARQQREADAQKAIAVADKEAAAARTGQIAALIPDLGTVKDSTFDVKDGPALWGTVLTFRALSSVADVIVSKIPLPAADPPGNTWRVLVTSDPQLATSDAVYQDVISGLSALISTAQTLLVATAPPSQDEVAPVGVGLDIATALVGAVPSVLSLLSSHRTVSTAAITVNDLAAAAAAAGALKEKASHVRVVHDDFRLVPPGGVYESVATLNSKRQQLTARKLTLGDQKSGFDAALAVAKATEKDLSKACTDAGDKATDSLRTQLGDARRAVAALTERSEDAAARIAMIDSLVTSIDTFTTALRAAAGGNRSPLATAALHGLLHSTAADKFTHVLLIKGQGGQTQQVATNRALWLKDKFSTVVDVNVTFVLIETADSGIIAAGNLGATASAYGVVGDEFTVVVK